MARLLTAGFESGITITTAQYGGERDANGVEVRQTGTTSYQATTARNGGRALQCGPSAANYEQVIGLTHTVDVPTYARFYFRFTAAPTETLQVWAWRLNGTVVATLDLLTTRALRLNVNASGSAGNSSVLSVDTWYRIETAITIPASGNGSVELRIDGVTAVGPSAGNVGTTLTTTTHRIGHVTGSETAATLYFDDLAINDGTGANQNTWPGPGNVTLLKPTSDNTKGTGWEGPQTTGSDTTDLYQNVDNVPPVGVAHSDVDANAGAYVFNAANLGAASDFRVNCQSMSDAGIPSSAIPVLTQAYMRASCDSTTGTNNMELQGITPADSAVTCNVEQTAVAGTEPTGWKSFRTVYTSLPTLAHATNPVVEATKILTGSTRAHMADQMGLLVEWITPVERSGAVSATASIASSGEFEAGAVVHSRSAAIGATGAVTADQERDLLRSASVGATGAIAASGVRVHQRSASMGATTGIATGHQRDLNRSVSANAAASISSSFQRELLGAAHLAATGDIGASFQRVLSRSTAITATALIASSGSKFEAMTYGGGTASTYGGGTAMSYAAATTSTYGSDEDWTYGDSPTYTYGG